MLMIGPQNLQGSEYAWTSAIFYFGYLVWSWPSSYLIVRLPLGKYVSVSVYVPPEYRSLGHAAHTLQVPLGRLFVVSRSREELRRSHGSKVFPRGRRGRNCTRVRVGYWHVL